MSNEIKSRIITAGYKAVEQLIKVAEEDILKEGEGVDLAADRLKNAAATKRLAIFDAFEILTRIEDEQENMKMINTGRSKNESKQGFAEKRSKTKSI